MSLPRCAIHARSTRDIIENLGYARFREELVKYNFKFDLNLYYQKSTSMLKSFCLGPFLLKISSITSTSKVPRVTYFS